MNGWMEARAENTAWENAFHAAEAPFVSSLIFNLKTSTEK